jgi:hypothetical protein
LGCRTVTHFVFSSNHSEPITFTDCKILLAKRRPVVSFLWPKFSAAILEEKMVSQQELDRRRKQGKLAGFLAVAWWIASIGGIIWVINATS